MTDFEPMTCKTCFHGTENQEDRKRHCDKCSLGCNGDWIPNSKPEWIPAVWFVEIERLKAEIKHLKGKVK